MKISKMWDKYLQKPQKETMCATNTLLRHTKTQMINNLIVKSQKKEETCHSACLVVA